MAIIIIIIIIIIKLTTVPNNKQDIIILHKEKNSHVNRCFISWRQKCYQERDEIILQYTDLIIEIQLIWNVKAKVI